MGQTLTEIAKFLKASNKQVQLIYGFNSTGKTRLSSEFKELIAPKNTEIEDEEAKTNIIYYNAFIEDLFYWDNDLNKDIDRKLKIEPNKYTKWVLIDQGKANDITYHFQRYTSDKLTPHFNGDFSEVHFSFERGDAGSPSTSNENNVRLQNKS